MRHLSCSIQRGGDLVCAKEEKNAGNVINDKMIEEGQPLVYLVRCSKNRRVSCSSLIHLLSKPNGMNQFAIFWNMV